jgi:hypothetical protein
MTTEYQVSEKEIENSSKVLRLLSQISDISYEQQENRPDIFIVNEPDSSLQCIVDVEEDTVISFMEITSFENEFPSDLAIDLLKFNNKAVHGAFTIEKNKLYFKSNLEIENLDLNELEASLRSVFFNVHEALPTISEAFSSPEEEITETEQLETTEA